LTTGANTFTLNNDAGDLAFRRNGSIVARVAAGGISGLAATSVSMASLASAVAEALNPVGVLAPYAGANAPAGWLLCGGQNISRTTFAGLFAVLGTTYGVGDGSTTFGVPDLRGRTVFGLDNMGGTAANRITNAISAIVGTTLGAVGGNQSMHAHTHTVTDPGHTHATGFNWAVAGGGSNAANATTGGLTAQNGVSSATTGISVQTAGTGASQNMPPAMMLNWIIKV
jgi:microcystin-dependent protein